MTDNNEQSKFVELFNSESGNHFAEKLAPLLQLNRLENIDDLISDIDQALDD